MKRIWIGGLLLAILLCNFATLSSCGTKTGDPSATGTEAATPAVSEPAESTETPVSDLLQLVQNGKAIVSVIYPQRDDNAKKCAVTVAENLAGITGVTPAVKDDFIRAGAQHDPEPVEILVGNTNYAQSAQVLEPLVYGEYEITAVGNKIVVAASYLEALEQAVYELDRLFRQNYSQPDNSVSLPRDLSKKGSVGGERLGDIPKLQLQNGQPVVSDCGNNTYMLYAGGVPESDYTGYLKTLANAGFENIRSSSNGSNRYETYAKGDLCLEVNYYASDSELRCIVLPKNYYTAYPAYFTKQQTSGTATPLFSQVGLNYTKVLNGMSYVLRTTENTFIVIDGGTAGQGEEDHIYNLLVEQSGSETPVIAAWIITHPHNDHIGAIADFVNKYASKVVPKAVIYNFARESILASSDYDASAFGTLRRALSGKWKTTALIKPHTGETLYIDGVEIEILHTVDDIFPDTEAMKNCNPTTMTFTMKVAGKTILITGDLNLDYEKEMVRWYGTGLKCDVLQVIHHGRTHGDISVYKIMNPSVALWPASKPSDDEYGKRDYNVWLKNNVPVNIYSYNGTAVLDLLTMKITQ